MGNWRTANIIGTMSEGHAAKLCDYLAYTFEPGDPGMARFGPLSFSRTRPSLCGLNRWPAPVMNVVGNLAERNYDPDDVAEHLKELVEVAGSMLLKVHCGGDYESLECLATVSVGEGVVVVGKPEVAEVSPLDDGQVTRNLFRALTGG